MAAETTGACKGYGEDNVFVVPPADPPIGFGECVILLSNRPELHGLACRPHLAFRLLSAVLESGVMLDRNLPLQHGDGDILVLLLLADP